MASSSSSSSAADPYAYEVPAPVRVPDSSVFRFGDREPMDFLTESRAEFVARTLTQPKSAAERVAEVAANNKSKLPFDDRGVYLTSDSRAHYAHHGAAYRPENMSKAATVGEGTSIVLGHNHAPSAQCAACARAAADAPAVGPPPEGAGYEAMNSQHRASFYAMELPRELTREERQAAIQVTRSGEAILKTFGKRPPEAVSAMEAGNRDMVASPSMRGVPAAGGDGKAGDSVVDGKARAKVVSIQLGTDSGPHNSESRAHFVDYAAGKPPAESPYLPENMVHEVDPSAAAGVPGQDEAKKWRLTVVDAATGGLKEIPRVKSAIDFGHDDYVVRSMYMDQTNCDKARLTTAGGWKRGTESFVPTIRPRFAANMKHPAVIAQAAAKAAAAADAATVEAASGGARR